MAPLHTPHHTRKVLLEAALREIHRRGFQACSLQNILADTGLTKGALYHHFPNKAALGLAVVDELLAAQVQQHYVDPLVLADDPITTLGGMMQHVLASADREFVELGCPVNNLALELSAADERFRARIHAVYERWRAGIAGALARGQRHGTVAPGVDPEQVATFLVGAVAGCRSLAKNAREIGPLRAGFACLGAYLETLRPDR